MKNMAEGKQKRKYLYEVDVLRLIFITGVLLNHTTTMVGNELATASWESSFLNMTHLSLHFTRMGFMFITGLVLFLQHYHKELHVWSFWKKRFLGVGIPYVSWCFLLLMGETLQQNAWSGVGNFLADLVHLITHGDDYYMYYIIVTMQLYVIFPVLVWLFKKFSNKHNLILGISFVFQIVLLFFIKYGLPHIDTSNWPYLMKNYGFSLLVYQFYFVLGAFASIHYEAFKGFIERKHRLIGWGTLILALGTLVEFYYNQHVLHLSLTKTLEIHQPYIFIYDLFIIGFVIWIGLQYAKYRENGLPQWLVKFVSIGAKVGFGMYLGQTVALTIMAGVLSALDIADIANFLLIPVMFIIIVLMDYYMSYFFYKIPPFGFLIGRPQWHVTNLWKKEKN